MESEQQFELKDRFEWSRESRCPHAMIRDVFGMPTVSAMLDYVADRQDGFEPVYGRNSKRSLIMKDLGPFRPQVESFVRAVAPMALAHFSLNESAIEPQEFRFAWHGDGGNLKTHVDTKTRIEEVRILSCIYYFAGTPRRFGGGELRLHGFRDLFRGSARPTVDVTPETDKLVIFPSWLEHEVLPVHVPSKAWRDSRFSVNCWIHRAPAAQ